MANLRLVRPLEYPPAPEQVYLGAPGWTAARVTCRGWYYAFREGEPLTDHQREAGLQPVVSGTCPQELLQQISEQNRRSGLLALAQARYSEAVRSMQRPT